MLNGISGALCLGKLRCQAILDHFLEDQVLAPPPSTVGVAFCPDNQMGEEGQREYLGVTNNLGKFQTGKWLCPVYCGELAIPRFSAPGTLGRSCHLPEPQLLHL